MPRRERDDPKGRRAAAVEVLAAARSLLAKMEAVESEAMKMLEAKRRDEEVLCPPRKGGPSHLLIAIEYRAPYTVPDGQNEKPVAVGRSDRPRHEMVYQQSERVG